MVEHLQFSMLRLDGKTLLPVNEIKFDDESVYSSRYS